MKASHREISQIVGYQEVKLLPGQFIFGRLKAAEETLLSQQKIRTCVNTLKKLQKLTIKTTNKFSIITIINWDIYQGNINEDNQQITNNQPTNNQQITTNKNDKHIKHNKNNNIPYEKIISYLNQKAKTNYKHTSKETQRCIKARFNAGFTVDDFKIVMNKKAGWLEDDKMCAFYRPVTLFGTKFESYLNETKKEYPIGDF